MQTYPPPSDTPPEVASEELDCVLELPNVSASRRQGNVCYSCGPEDEVISALPRIGCLPDESFSKHEERRVKAAEGRWWEEVRRSIERGRSWTKDKGGGV
jgi:3'-phosphoadenosine 5'-phosphosulfate sulfotransferase (PAPS reductase)/FAD synthetase